MPGEGKQRDWEEEQEGITGFVGEDQWGSRAAHDEDGGGDDGNVSEAGGW